MQVLNCFGSTELAADNNLPQWQLKRSLTRIRDEEERGTRPGWQIVPGGARPGGSAASGLAE
jgi:hypothetical protein